MVLAPKIRGDGLKDDSGVQKCKCRVVASGRGLAMRGAGESSIFFKY